MLLAVSGQNIAFLVTGVLAFSWLCDIPRRLGEVLALATIVALSRSSYKGARMSP